MTKIVYSSDTSDKIAEDVRLIKQAVCARWRHRTPATYLHKILLHVRRYEKNSTLLLRIRASIAVT